MADLPSDQFQVFARYDQWANQRLYEACSKLDDGTYQKERPTFFTRRIPMAQIFDADGHVFEDTEEMGKRMPKMYRDWKYAHGLFAKQPWFPPLGHLHTPTGVFPKGDLATEVGPASLRGSSSSTRPASKAPCFIPQLG